MCCYNRVLADPISVTTIPVLLLEKEISTVIKEWVFVIRTDIIVTRVTVSPKSDRQHPIVAAHRSAFRYSVSYPSLIYTLGCSVTISAGNQPNFLDGYVHRVAWYVHCWCAPPVIPQ